MRSRRDLDLGPRDRERAFQTVNVQIFRPDVVGGRREHGVQPTITEHDLARGRDNEAGLKVKAGEMPIRFIGIAGQEKVLRLGYPAECFIFRPAFLKRGLVREIRDRDAAGITGQQIFGENGKADRVARILLDEHARRAQFRSDRLDGLEHLRPRRRPIPATLDRPRGQLQRKRSVSHNPSAPGFIVPSGSTARFTASSTCQPAGSLRSFSG